MSQEERIITMIEFMDYKIKIRKLSLHLMPCKSTISSARTHAHSMTTRAQMAMRTVLLLMYLRVFRRHL